MASKKFQNNHHTEIIYSKKNGQRYKRKNERHETLSIPRVDRIKMKMLEYEGRNVIEVKENHTSMTCTSCGWQNKNLKASKIFECKKCPLVLERDIRGTEQGIS